MKMARNRETASSRGVAGHRLNGEALPNRGSIADSAIEIPIDVVAWNTKADTGQWSDSDGFCRSCRNGNITEPFNVSVSKRVIGTIQVLFGIRPLA